MSSYITLIQYKQSPIRFSDIDLALSALTLPPGFAIPRGYPLSLPVTATMEHPGAANIRTVVPLVDSKYNFKAHYVLSSVNITNSTDMMLNYAYNVSAMADVERQKGMPVGGSADLGTYITCIC